MRKVLIPLFCLWHMAAIFWWSLPHSFGGLMVENQEQNTFEARMLPRFMPNEKSWLSTIFRVYIDITGSQQYWDFFAPNSSNYHQYLTVCAAIVNHPRQGTISCQGKPLFSNLNDDFAAFQGFQRNDQSRNYRLTENLVKLNDFLLFESFTRYYLHHQDNKGYPNENDEAYLVLHQFELHPELTDLPKAGYRLDKILWLSR